MPRRGCVSYPSIHVCMHMHLAQYTSIHIRVRACTLPSVPPWYALAPCPRRSSCAQTLPQAPAAHPRSCHPEATPHATPQRHSPRHSQVPLHSAYPPHQAQQSTHPMAAAEVLVVQGRVAGRRARPQGVSVADLPAPTAGQPNGSGSLSPSPRTSRGAAAVGRHKAAAVVHLDQQPSPHPHHEHWALVVAHCPTPAWAPCRSFPPAQSPSPGRTSSSSSRSLQPPSTCPWAQPCSQTCSPAAAAPQQMACNRCSSCWPASRPPNRLPPLRRFPGATPQPAHHSHPHQRQQDLLAFLLPSGHLSLQPLQQQHQHHQHQQQQQGLPTASWAAAQAWLAAHA